MIENLVFEGGGVKGIAYAGVLAGLEKHGFMPRIKRVAGASAGSIVASLVAMGASAKQVQDIVGGTSFSKFKDSGGLLEIYQVLHNYGIYKGDALLRWLRQNAKMLTGKEDPTFAELKLDLRVVVTCVELGSPVILSRDTTPAHSVPGAVRLSAGIPGFFSSIADPVDGYHYSDGGELWNYPVSIFDGKGVDPLSTLGFKLGISRAPGPVTINSFKDYAAAHISMLTDHANSEHVSTEDVLRTVFVDTLGVRSTQFDVDKKTQLQLVEKGLEAFTEWVGKNTQASR